MSEEQSSLLEDDDPGEQFCITRDGNGQATLRAKIPSILWPPLKRGEKMNFLRNRMTMVRKKKELEEKIIREKLDRKGKRRAQTFKGAKIIDANEKDTGRHSG